MTFEPKPGMRIALNGKSIEFTPLEASGPASMFVYAEAGKEGIVYKVLIDQKPYALKVFYPEYQDKRLTKNAEKLNQFKTLRGLAVADRTVINSKSFPNLLDRFPELNYSVLMPWIQGMVWGNLMVNSRPLKAENYTQIAKILMTTVRGLETQGLAHCDLSNNNFIIDSTFSSIELIDIEDMYAPDMPRPIPDVSYGTLGYRTKWIAENGLWGPSSDRFASAILCAEILTWRNKEIRDNKAGDASFFDEAEVGETSERYHMMKSYLGNLSVDFPDLFDQAWFSKNPDKCPPVSEWLNGIHKIDSSEVIEEAPGHPNHVPIIDGPKTDKPENGIEHGVPPKMEVSQSTVDFGLVQQGAAFAKILIENTGGSVLEGTIETASWIETKPGSFKIQPGDKRVISVSLGTSRPKPTPGVEYRTPNALVITSNGGAEVIGAKYRVPKQPFYKTWFGLLGIFVIGICLISILLAGGIGMITAAPMILPTSALESPISTATRFFTPLPTSAPPTAFASPVPDTPTPKVNKFFTEEFDGDLSDWSDFLVNGRSSAITNQVFNDVSLRLENGSYLFDVDHGYIWAYSMYEPFEYADVRVDALTQNEGANNNNVSLICRYSEKEGWYEFNIANNGLYWILYAHPNVNGVINYDLLADGGSTEIESGKKANEYTIICKGNKLSLYINRNLIKEITENIFVLDKGKVGVSVSSFELSAKVSFDWVKISQP